MVNLRSKVHLKLLKYYFANPKSSPHLRELSKIISEDPGYLSRELARLEKEGLFLSYKIGQQKYFEINKRYFLYEELRKIIRKISEKTNI